MIEYTFKTTKISIAKIGMKNEIRIKTSQANQYERNQSSTFLMEEFQEQLILLCQQNRFRLLQIYNVFEMIGISTISFCKIL